MAKTSLTSKTRGKKGKTEKLKTSNEEAIKNLLIMLARVNGVTPEAIALATGSSEKYIANTYTMKLLTGDKNKKQE